MKKQRNPLALLILLFLTACSGGDIYTKSDFSDITNSHKRVAILPFIVSYDAKSISKEFTIETAKKAEKEESKKLEPVKTVCVFGYCARCDSDGLRSGWSVRLRCLVPATPTPGRIQN